jgi:ferredoxin
MTPRSFAITLLPSKRKFTSTGETSILEAAALAGLRLSSSCRNGTCRACLCHLKTGNVHYKIEWPGLTVGEKAEGWILPCVALPLSDIQIDASFELLPASVDAKLGRGRGF